MADRPMIASSQASPDKADTLRWRQAHESPLSWKQWRNLGDQFLHLVAVELRLLHKRSMIGMAWTLVNPIVQLVIFTVVLGRVLAVDTLYYPVFLCCGLLCWNAFSESLTMASASIVNTRYVLYQPGFRPAMMPLVFVVMGQAHFLLSLSILAALLVYFQIPLGWPVLALPLLLLVQGLLTLALAFPLAALSVSFYDTKHLLSVALRFLFFLTPILYATDNFPRVLQILYAANPLTHLIRGYRAIFIDGVWPDWPALIGVAAGSAIVLVVGYRFFEARRFRFIEDIE
ncbi:MAG: ABC transporter permease [Novosphingobium sp.]|nr:ABC transporter permease [Novosphingobium sp.]